MMGRITWYTTAALTVLLVPSGCRTVGLRDLATPRPVAPDACLAIGFLGGHDRWDDDTKGVRRLALDLRDPERNVHAETFENRRTDVALAFLEDALDQDRDGAVEPSEIRGLRIVVYGQSLGGFAATVFSRALAERGIPIDLLVLVDSVGWGDEVIPPNVRHVANFYQDEGRFVAGEHPVRPLDPGATTVLGEWELEYDEPPGSEIDLGDLPWHKTAFRVAHARMDRDPRLWRRVGRLVEAACAGRDLERVVSLPGRDRGRDEAP